MRTKTFALSVLVLAAAAGPAAAQQLLKVPEPSPAAEVEQTVGLTNLKINYHRPAVAGRKVWGELVPFGEVWRVGANENTTISFSSPVKIGGKTVAAGTYGLHAIPTAKDWTVIFNRVSSGWGSYAYDAKDDALRLTVTPQPSEAFEERLSYRFDDPTEGSVVAALRWEKLKLPIKIDVDTPAVVMASMRDQLHGAPQFNPDAWAQAARYWVGHGGNLDEAQKMADRSIAMRETFNNVSVKAAIAEKKGDTKTATALRTHSMEIATEADLNQYGYGLIGQKKVDEAISIFQKNVSAHPASWNAYDSLAEAYLVKGDKKAAADNYGKALTMVKDAPNKKRIEQTLSKLK
jgi:tetratricopeptide (TPR) repeat protein